MFRKYYCLVAFVFSVWACLPSVAHSQLSPQPLSQPGGYAGTEMRSIYREAIGTGYSANSLNQQSLNRAAARIPNVGQFTAPRGRINSGIGGFGSASKPFSNFSPAPTVSPYLNLFREDSNGSDDFNYNTLVRPMLQQQQLNEQLQRQNYDIGQRLQSIAAQSDFNPQGSTSQPPTGHQTVFMYYGHYYPAPQRRR